MNRREKNDRVLSAMRGARFGRKWIRIACPFCADDGHRDSKLSLGVHAATGIWRCFRCETYGRLPEAPDPSFEDHEPTRLKPEERPLLDPPAGYYPLAGPERRSEALKPARRYLRARSIPERLWEPYRVGAAIEGFWAGRIIIPVLAEDGDGWWGWVARLWANPAPGAFGRDGMKYLNSEGLSREVLWNHREVVRETDEPLLIVEGLFDAIPHAPHTAAVLGKPTHAQIDVLLESPRPLVIALDGDAWMQAHMLSLQLQFAGKTAGALRLPPGVDPNTIPTKALLAAAHASLGQYDPVRL